MAGDLDALEKYLVDLTDRLTPAERAKAGRRIAAELQKANAARIGANVDPEGSPFVPRKKARRLRGRGRSEIRTRRKQGKMFLRAKAKSNLKARADASEARVGFVGAMVRIMGVHQDGLEDHVTRDPSSPIVKYPARRVLGFGPEDRLMVLETLDRLLQG